MSTPSENESLAVRAYEELRRLARAAMRHERVGHTLDPTALVHEAYLRLARGGGLDVEDEAAFAAAAAGTVRRVLVDHARSRGRQKRGGDRGRISLEHAEASVATSDVDPVELDELLERLAESSPRQARVVELRFFGGMQVEDIARFLDVSERTVKTDWRAAKAWLRVRLDGAADSNATREADDGGAA